VLPRHPLYGREVVVLDRRRESNVTVCCIVALPETPAFHYRLRERWLESTPPSMPAPSPPGAVRLPLAALDTLTQRLLGFQRAESAYGEAGLVGACPSSHLESAAAAGPAALDRAVGVSAAHDRFGSDE
jgi:hypothetical protein